MTHRPLSILKQLADDQQMRVGLLLKRIEEKQNSTDETARLTSVCVRESERMVDAAHTLNEATHRFIARSRCSVSLGRPFHPFLAIDRGCSRR
ncbi:MAG: hypothetical protein KKF58_03270 [Gammaproteobacteria bacterium]|nr:hypothetical protein [Gammaproteobacteria bacterium]MBU1447309.1 hypothetical protein [Gammaproteobacteria bacterium]MDD5471771.1 hypothetical protein [Sideroxydans sp.]